MSLTPAFFFIYSGIKTVQSFWSSWTLRCDATVEGYSGVQVLTPAEVKEDKQRGFWEREDSQGHSYISAMWDTFKPQTLQIHAHVLILSLMFHLH